MGATPGSFKESESILDKLHKESSFMMSTRTLKHSGRHLAVWSRPTYVYKTLRTAPVYSIYGLRSLDRIVFVAKYLWEKLRTVRKIGNAWDLSFYKKQ